MNFSGLKRLIESADHQAFYDVALLQLEMLGYRDLNIVDGPNDGGKDVDSDREHVQIQLSVRKDWDKKLSEEAAKAIQAGKKHLVYLTNRHITQNAEAVFRRGFKYRSQIELTIYDSNRIATGLSAPGRIARSYKLLGVDVRVSSKVELKDIAASVAILFGDEAQEVRERTVDALVLSWMRSHSDQVRFGEAQIVEGVAKQLPGSHPPRLVASSVSRLRGKKLLQGSADAVSLSEQAKEQVDSAESEVFAAREADILLVRERFEVSSETAAKLLDKAIELLVRLNRAGWSIAAEEDYIGFLGERGLMARKIEIDEFLPALATIKKFSYIQTIDSVFSANTFDIFRAFGGKTEISIVLDTSVALPLMFGSEFGERLTGYSTASSVMKQVADAHGFNLSVPSPYLNEMASHGMRALEFLDIYHSFEPELRAVMRSSPNAYISHYAAFAERRASGKTEALPLKEFLAHFGVRVGGTVRSAERFISGILEAHRISILQCSRYEKSILEELQDRKPHEHDVIVKHDAIVATELQRTHQTGWIFATWDRVLIELVQGQLRIYADNPGRIVDWLSFAQGIETGIDGSVDTMMALAMVDERITSELAEKLQHIRNTDEAFALNALIREARQQKGVAELPLDDIARIVDENIRMEHRKSPESDVQPVRSPEG
jgi:NACalpha-BTF3-like transcription factor